MNEMNDKIIGNVEKELDEIEIIDTESIEEKLSFIVYGTIAVSYTHLSPESTTLQDVPM